MVECDVIVVGAGLAGLVCARELSKRGLVVVLIDRKRGVDKHVHTTGIFVRRTFVDFSLPSRCLGRPIREVRLYSPKRRKVVFRSRRDEFRIGRMAELYRDLLAEAKRSGTLWVPRAAFLDASNGMAQIACGRRRVQIKARYIVGADGVNSRVARSLELACNSQWIVGVEDVFDAPSNSGEPQLHCFVDPKLAPGYIAWVANDGDEIHVGVGGYPSEFQPAQSLDIFRDSLGDIVDLRKAPRRERRGGRIPVGGLLDRIACERGLLVGDASGAVSPLTAGGLDPCLRQAHAAAIAISNYLRYDDACGIEAYAGTALRDRFLVRRGLRTLFDYVKSPMVAEWACALLRLPGVYNAGQQAFFGRGSFPDVQIPDLSNGESPDFQSGKYNQYSLQSKISV